MTENKPEYAIHIHDGSQKEVDELLDKIHRTDKLSERSNYLKKLSQYLPRAYHMEALNEYQENLQKPVSEEKNISKKAYETLQERETTKKNISSSQKSIEDGNLRYLDSEAKKIRDLMN